MKKFLCYLILISLILSFTACSKADKQYGVSKEAEVVSDKSSDINNELPEIMTLDRKMSNYFDTSLFDEENYSEEYLGKKFKYNVVFDGCTLTVPQKMEDFIKGGWTLSPGSEYDENSLVFAKETVSLNFVNQNGSTVWTLFYNSSNSSVKLSKCRIVKFKIVNNYYQNTTDYDKFSINNITNTSSVLDVVNILGTPSHFYQVTENDYYFDYFISKSDRRNKIRVYVNLVDDSVTVVEFSYYK